jgi:Tfp pilus assembly protein FimT
MGMQKSKANLTTTRTGGGFSAIELLITATVLTIVTGLGLMGITRARASVRLSGAAREYASYIEKARIHSIRNHADEAGERANVAIDEARTSYDVTMDLDGDGDLDTRTITLPSDVTFETVETIAFDWRGRTWSTVGGVTSANAQVSIRLQGANDTVSIDVTGSGDITIDSQVFDDSVPTVTLKVGDLAAGATPVPTPVSEPTPETPVPVATPDPSQLPIDLPTPPDGGDVIPVPTPKPESSPTPRSTPTPNATPTPTSTPTPEPTPSVCTLNADKVTVIMGREATATIKISHTASTTLSVSGTSSKPSDLQVTPAAAQDVAPGAAASFTIKSKKTSGTYSVTFSTSCGSKVVPVVILL